MAAITPLPRLAVVIVAVSSSAAAAPPPRPASASAGVTVTATEVRLDGQRLDVTPASLARDRAPLLKALAAGAHGPMVLTYTSDAAADAVLAALRAIEESGTAATSIRAGAPAAEVCQATAPKVAKDERVDLLIRLLPDRATRALTRVNEVAELPTAGEALARDLDAQKASAYFADRDEVILAVDPGVKGAALTPLVRALCKAGFRALRPLAMDETTALITLSESSGPAWRPLGAAEPVSLGAPTIEGEYGKETILAILKSHVPKLAACTTKARLGGAVTARFSIGPSGKVVKSEATGDAPAVATCTARVIKAATFPRPGHGAVEVTAPMTFAAPRPRGILSH
jgi:hypothetical protein